jgi:uncharacterized glyoxalase superfamily protein PhnB
MSDAPQPFQQVVPYLLYEDCRAALEFLSRAFGFGERLHYENEVGTITHAEMRLGGRGTIFMGAPGPEYSGPGRDGRVTVEVYVYVDDVDDHFRRARDEGAVIREEPADTAYGDRRYAAEDPEGHHWFFAQRVNEVLPAEWGAVEATG